MPNKYKEKTNLVELSTVDNDRNEDGDIDITDNTNLVSAMYMRKQGMYAENRIFPYAEISELKSELFIKARKLAANQKPNHPWKSMDDLELLKSAGLMQFFVGKI